MSQPDFAAAEAWGEELKTLVGKLRAEARAARRAERSKEEETLVLQVNGGVVDMEVRNYDKRSYN